MALHDDLVKALQGCATPQEGADAALEVVAWWVCPAPVSTKASDHLWAEYRTRVKLHRKLMEARRAQ
jgi:hypothetical protein